MYEFRSFLGLLLLTCLIVGGVAAEDNPAAGLIGAEAAVTSATRFLQACGLALPRKGTPHTSLSNRAGSGWEWRVTWQEPGWGGAYKVIIDARSGQVQSFFNYAREYEQVKGINRTGKKFYRSREEAENYLKHLAQAIGVPAGAVYWGLDIVEDKQPGRTDANPAGRVSISYVQRPYGYPILTAHGKEGAAMTVTADPQDGTVMFVWKAPPVDIEAHMVNFPKDKAVAKAKQVYAEYYRTRTSPHKGTYKGKVELGYVLPNGTFGGKRYPRQVPFRIRLAWAVYFGEEAVWIDAGDGSILGGVILK